MACILIIEDNESVRTMLARLLGYFGHEVVEAVDGTMGIELFRTRPFDLVFTDLIMPGKNGFEVIDEIRRRSPATGIVAMSGGSTDAPATGPQSAGDPEADWVLQKPFSIGTLQAILADLLAERAAPPPARGPGP